MPAVASGIVGFGGAALAGGSIGSMICPGIGTGVGIAAGLVVEAAAMAFTSIAKVVSANTSAAVVDIVLDYFQEKYEKEDAVMHQIIDSFSSVVA